MPLTKVDAQLLEGAITADSNGRLQINGASGTYVANIFDPSNAFLGFIAGSGLPALIGQDFNGDGYVYNTKNATLRFGTNGVETLRIAADGTLTMRVAAGMGYGTGAGGTVTQTTSKSTAVTLNRPTGQITMHNAALGAAGVAVFICNNSLVTTSDVVVVTPSNNANYTAICQATTAGQFYVRVTNITGGSLSEALVINFAVIKGATA